MINKMSSYIEKNQMIKKNDFVVLGLSGGPDSMCLFHLLLQYMDIIPFRMQVVHINHMLREEAKEEARFVEKECRRFKIPCEIITVSVEEFAKEEKISTEEAGRVIRYQTFEKMLQIDKEKNGKTSNGKIAIAHNKNDVSETVLFHLFRGTGMQGLTGILPVNGNIIRPILCFDREEIEFYLEKEGISYCTDRSNEDDLYTRNRIRHHILPYAEKEICENVVEHIFDTAEMIKETQDYILDVVEKEKEDITIERNHKIFIKKDEFEKLHGTIKNELLRSVLFQVAKQRKDISKTHILDIRKLFDKQVGKEICLPYNMCASRDYDGISIKKKEEKNTRYQPRKLEMGRQIDAVLGELFVEVMDTIDLSEIPEKKYTKWFDYDKIIRCLFLRTRSSGDYLIINKEGSRKTVKEYMINEKIPKEKRDQMVLLADDKHIVWIPGYRISEEYKVTENTKRVIKIQISGLE